MGKKEGRGGGKEGGKEEGRKEGRGEKNRERGGEEEKDRRVGVWGCLRYLQRCDLYSASHLHKFFFFKQVRERS